MEALIGPAVAEFLRANGLIGLVIVGLAWAFYRKDLQVSEIQNARIQDSKDLSTALNASTAATAVSTQQYHNLELVIRGVLESRK